MSIPCTEYKYILPSYSKYELESGHSTDTKRINYHFVASPYKLELAIFLAQLRIIDISTKNLHGRVIPSEYFQAPFQSNRTEYSLNPDYFYPHPG